jgi:hypothetical protein
MEQTALYMSKDVAMEGKLRHVQVVNTMAGRRDQRVSTFTFTFTFRSCRQQRRINALERQLYIITIFTFTLLYT